MLSARTFMFAAALSLLGTGAQAMGACSPDTVGQAQCKTAEIAGLDREIAQAYTSAAALMDTTGRQRLRKDQDAYEKIRKSGDAERNFDLAAQMTLRRDFLKAIVEPKGRWTGHWANAQGTIDISPGPKGALRVRATSAEPTLGAWLCEFDDSAVVAGNVMIVGAESALMELGGPNEGWTLALRLTGDTLLLDALPPRGSTAKAPFCGSGGVIGGAYFAQKAPAR